MAAERSDRLLALAAQCETARRPDRALDVDIYEALGFAIRRKPTHSTSRRIPPGGIYRDGALWKTIGRISAEIDVAVTVLRERAPGWNWSLQSVMSEGEAFEALVAGSSGHASLGSLALCAALLRALAGRTAQNHADEATFPSDAAPPSRKVDPA